MARNSKHTVDYFPHPCNPPENLSIVEGQLGNDGFAVFYKIWEVLGRSPYHYYDCREPAKWHNLVNIMKVKESELLKILDMLAILYEIDKELWSKKIIWSNNLLENVADAYKRRNDLCIHYSDLCKHLKLKCKHKYISSDINVYINPQIKENKIKENKIKYYLGIFERFYKKFPSTKKEIGTEFENFKKHNDWTTIIDKLEPALDNHIIWRRLQKNNGMSVTYWKSMGRWITERCWEEIHLKNEIIEKK